MPRAKMIIGLCSALASVVAIAAIFTFSTMQISSIQDQHSYTLHWPIVRIQILWQAENGIVDARRLVNYIGTYAALPDAQMRNENIAILQNHLAHNHQHINFALDQFRHSVLSDFMLSESNRNMKMEWIGGLESAINDYFHNYAAPIAQIARDGELDYVIEIIRESFATIYYAYNYLHNLNVFASAIIATAEDDLFAKSFSSVIIIITISAAGIISGAISALIFASERKRNQLS